MHFLEESRTPKGESAQSEGVGDIAPHDQLVVGVQEQFQVVARNWFSDYLISPEFSLSAARFGERQEHQGQKQPGNACPDKRVSPGPVCGDLSAKNITQSRTDRDGDVKNGERIVATGRVEGIRDQAGAN